MTDQTSDQPKTEPEDPRLRSILTTLIEKMTENGIYPDRLIAVSLGGEFYFGMSLEADPRPGSVVTLRDPKRILRIQREDPPGNLLLDLVLLDLDVVEGGLVSFQPTICYAYEDLDDKSKARMLSLYARYFEQKRMARMRASGIVTPSFQAPAGLGSSSPTR